MPTESRSLAFDDMTSAFASLEFDDIPSASRSLAFDDIPSFESLNASKLFNNSTTFASFNSYEFQQFSEEFNSSDIQHLPANGTLSSSPPCSKENVIQKTTTNNNNKNNNATKFNVPIITTAIVAQELLRKKKSDDLLNYALRDLCRKSNNKESSSSENGEVHGNALLTAVATTTIDNKQCAEDKKLEHKRQHNNDKISTKMNVPITAIETKLGNMKNKQSTNALMQCTRNHRSKELSTRKEGDQPSLPSTRKNRDYKNSKSTTTISNIAHEIRSIPRRNHRATRGNRNAITISNNSSDDDNHRRSKSTSPSRKNHGAADLHYKVDDSFADLITSQKKREQLRIHNHNHRRKPSLSNYTRSKSMSSQREESKTATTRKAAFYPNLSPKGKHERLRSSNQRRKIVSIEKTMKKNEHGEERLHSNAALANRSRRHLYDNHKF